MFKPVFWLLMGGVLLLSACAETGSKSSTAPNDSDNPFAGTYRGEEVLTGGTFPIKIVIDSDGEVRLTDIDNITGTGDLEGANFVINRLVPYQVFEGTVSGTEITGTTHGNTTFGGGTFTASRI